MKWKNNSDLLDEGKEPNRTPAAAYFFCYECGAILTTDVDRKQHLEREAHVQTDEHLAHE